MTDFLVDAWAATMWKACWQGSLVVLAVWLICLAIPSMPARCRCWLWRLAILKFMVVLLLPTLVNLPLLPAPPVASPMPEVVVQIVRQQVQVRPIEPVEIHPSRAVELPSIPATLALFWIIGVGWSLARLLLAWHGARKLHKQSRLIETTPLIEQLAIQASHYRLRTSPRLLATEGNGSPMLIGILRPSIVIPAGTLRKLSPPELAMVLGHELAHIRRGDLIWGLAAAGVRAVFFFNPLVWLSQRRLNLAQEVAADELAILRQHGDPASYGKLLVSVISKLGPSRLIPTMSMGTAGSVQSLTRRLVAMTNIGRASRGIIVTSGILLAATVLLGIVPWRLVAAEPKENKEQQTINACPEAPATAPLILPENQRLALIDVWERKGQDKISLCQPNLTYVFGHEANFAAGGLEMRIHSLADKKPFQHVIEAKLIRDPTGKNPVTLMVPKLTLNDNTRGIVSATEADGSELFVEVAIIANIAKAANAKPLYCVRCRFVDAKGSVLFAPTLGLEDGKEGIVSNGSQTPFVVGFTTENKVKQPHIVVLSEGTSIHVSVVSEAGQEATGATLDVTIEQSKIGDVDTTTVDPKTAIQIPHIAFQKKRVIDFVKYGKVMTIPMADKSASGNEPRIELIVGPPGKEIETPADWSIVSPARAITSVVPSMPTVEKSAATATEPTPLGRWSLQELSGDDFLFGDDSIPTPTLYKMEAAFGKAGLNGFSIQGGRVKVPHSQRATYLAVLADAKALPPKYATEKAGK